MNVETVTGNVFFGRQPICQDRAEVFGYKLMFQDGESGQAISRERNSKAARRFVDSLIERLHKVVPSNVAFIKVDRNFLLSEYVSSLPSDRVVLEIAENTVVDKPLLDSLRKLSKAGYSIALDGFSTSDQFRPLAEFTDSVKLDIKEVNPDAVVRQVEALRQFDVKLVAKPVDNQPDYDFCSGLKLISAPALPVIFSNTGLGQQLSQVARIISAHGALGMKRQIFFVGMDGYDNHEDLVNKQQQLLA